MRRSPSIPRQRQRAPAIPRASASTCAHGRGPAESGQAVAGFVMVVPLLLMVALALLGLATALHVRLIILDSAAEGARLGAYTNLDLARTRTSELISAALPHEYGENIRAAYRDVRGVSVVEVTVVSPIPILGMIGPTTMEVRAHAAIE